MKLHTINTGFFKLDGGAMFGVVPKTIWNNLAPADENNMCTWAMRCLLVESDNRLILIDCGIGNKQDEKFFSRYFLHGEDSLEKSLQNNGFTFGDITDVFLTHLHFDHCGGAVNWNNDKTGFELAFPNADYWVSERHWEWSMHPNKRESASFLKENMLPIQECGHLKLVNADTDIMPGFNFLYANGHTEGMMLPQINVKGNTIVYMADLIPSTAHVSLPYVMAYDMFPLITLEEKEKFLNDAVDNNFILFFEHDPVTECCTVKRTEKGFKVTEKFKLEDILQE